MEDLQPLRARSAGRAMGDAKARQSSPARQVSPKGLRRAPKLEQHLAMRADRQTRPGSPEMRSEQKIGGLSRV